MANDPKDSNKDGLELNKFAAAILLAGLIAMIAGTVARVAYKPVHSEKRGFSVEVVEEGATGAAPVAEPDVATALATATVEAGAKVSSKCASCHSFEQGGANKVGPNLYGILNEKHAARADFAYSDALKGKAGPWDYEALYHFLKDPKAYAPGTKMGFAGLKKPEDRANMIAYLRSLGKASVPLPTPPVQK